MSHCRRACLRRWGKSFFRYTSALWFFLFRWFGKMSCRGGECLFFAAIISLRWFIFFFFFGILKKNALGEIVVFFVTFFQIRLVVIQLDTSYWFFSFSFADSNSGSSRPLYFPHPPVLISRGRYLIKKAFQKGFQFARAIASLSLWSFNVADRQTAPFFLLLLLSLSFELACNFLIVTTMSFFFYSWKRFFFLEKLGKMRMWRSWVDKMRLRPCSRF